MFLENEVEFSFSVFYENVFGWNGGVFIFYFRKFGKTIKISFLIYIQVRKQKKFIFLENFWKLNEPNVFSKFWISLENFPRPNASLVVLILSHVSWSWLIFFPLHKQLRPCNLYLRCGHMAKSMWSSLHPYY